jgi:hypothetical protein
MTVLCRIDRNLSSLNLLTGSSLYQIAMIFRASELLFLRPEAASLPT